MARLMRATFRYHDRLYRFGGEEFVVRGGGELDDGPQVGDVELC